jgi:hypothetical protein
MADGERPVPNCVRYGFGKDIGHVELNADGTAEFWLGPVDPMDHGVKMGQEELGVLREVVKHLERGGFED